MAKQKKGLLSQTKVAKDLSRAAATMNRISKVLSRGGRLMVDCSKQNNGDTKCGTDAGVKPFTLFAI